MTTTDDVLDFIQTLYTSASNLQQWEHCLDHAARLFDSRDAQLLHTDLRAGTPQHQFQAKSNTPIPIDEHVELLYELAPRDPRYPAHVGQPWHPGLPDTTPAEILKCWGDGIPFTCRTFVNESDLRQSEIYRRLLKPCGVEYTLMTCTVLSDVEQTTFALFRGPDQPPFGESERALLGKLVPHIRQAAALHRRLLNLDFERRAAMESLNGVNVAMILLARGGEVVFANDSAVAIGDAVDGISFQEGAVDFVDPGARRALNRALASLASAGEADRSLLSIPLAIGRPSGGPDYLATLSALRGLHLNPSPLARGRPLALLMVVDPSRELVRADLLLERLYGLTPMEAKVLSELLGGRPQTSVANELSISINTVKTHLRQVFRKTNTRRQAELVGKVKEAVGGLI